MAWTVLKISASPNHLTYRLTGDGAKTASIIANATILADMVAGPLKNAWNSTFALASATTVLRPQLLGGKTPHFCDANLQMQGAGVFTTGDNDQVAIDVDYDATTATKAEINVGASSDTVGQVGYLTLRHRHTAVR
jgi:hypothetical protein